jgi:hypothetical protein
MAFLTLCIAAPEDADAQPKCIKFEVVPDVMAGSCRQSCWPRCLFEPSPTDEDWHRFVTSVLDLEIVSVQSDQHIRFQSIPV